MGVALGGDRSSILTQRLAARTYFFAVASGFGTIDGEPAARRALHRLGEELRRRARHDRFARSASKPKRIGSSLAAGLANVNAYVHGRSASHADYVTAACSLTAVLVLNERAYVAHTGSTAGYLARAGRVLPLTQPDAFDGDDGLPVLLSALGVEPEIRVPISSFGLQTGDALVLRAYGDRVLVVRYDGQVPAPAEPSARWSPGRLLFAAVGALGFFALLCIR